MLFALIRGAAVALLCAAPLAAAAQTFETGFAQFGADQTEPIEIEADELEVQDRANIAVFTGNVTVTQADAALQTARLTVHYAGSPTAAGAADAASGASADAPAQDGAAAAGEAPAPAPATPQNRRISRLVADGRVLITSDGQSATGDAGTVDFDARTLELTGNVTLTQAGNVVTGESLTVDLNTGIARVQSSGRVRVLLKPGGN